MVAHPKVLQLSATSMALVFFTEGWGGDKFFFLLDMKQLWWERFEKWLACLNWNILTDSDWNQKQEWMTFWTCLFLFLRFVWIFSFPVLQEKQKSHYSAFGALSQVNQQPKVPSGAPTKSKGFWFGHGTWSSTWAMKKTGCLGYIGDCTAQLRGYYSKPFPTFRGSHVPIFLFCLLCVSRGF